MSEFCVCVSGRTLWNPFSVAFILENKELGFFISGLEHFCLSSNTDGIVSFSPHLLSL